MKFFIGDKILRGQNVYEVVGYDLKWIIIRFKDGNYSVPPESCELYEPLSN